MLRHGYQVTVRSVSRLDQLARFPFTISRVVKTINNCETFVQKIISLTAGEEGLYFIVYFTVNL